MNTDLNKLHPKYTVIIDQNKVMVAGLVTLILCHDYDPETGKSKIEELSNGAHKISCVLVRQPKMISLEYEEKIIIIGGSADFILAILPEFGHCTQKKLDEIDHLLQADDFLRIDVPEGPPGLN
jgi:hypothetical protein